MTFDIAYRSNEVKPEGKRKHAARKTSEEIVWEKSPSTDAL